MSSACFFSTNNDGCALVIDHNAMSGIDRAEVEAKSFMFGSFPWKNNINENRNSKFLISQFHFRAGRNYSFALLFLTTVTTVLYSLFHEKENQKKTTVVQDIVQYRATNKLTNSLVYLFTTSKPLAMTTTTINKKMDAQKMAPVKESPQDPPCKAIVAKSDFDHAMNAIDSYMDAQRSSLREDASAKSADGEEMDVGDHGMEGERDDAKHNSERPDPQDAFLAQCHASLKERLHECVAPISDEEYHQRTRGHIIEAQIWEEQEDEREQISREDAAFRAKEEALLEIERLKTNKMNIEYDDHELIDQDALKRARELRAKVRNLSMLTTQKQETLLQRAIQLTKRKITLLTEGIREEQVDPLSQDRNEEISTANRLALQQMEASIQALTNSLASTVNIALPKNLRDLRDTIKNIQKSLQKRELPLSLSQTEHAIVSRENEGSSQLCSVTEDEDDPVRIELEAFSDMSNPEFLLANFLSTF